MKALAHIDKLWVETPGVRPHPELQVFATGKRLSQRGFGYDVAPVHHLLGGRFNLSVYRSNFHNKTEYQFNLTEWDSFKGFIAFLNRILSNSYRDAKIRKLTYFVEVPLPIEEVGKWAKVTRKIISEDFESPSKRTTRRSGRVEKMTLTRSFGSPKRTRIQLYDSTEVHGGTVPRTRISVEFSDPQQIKFRHPLELRKLYEE